MNEKLSHHTHKHKDLSIHLLFAKVGYLKQRLLTKSISHWMSAHLHEWKMLSQAFDMSLDYHSSNRQQKCRTFFSSSFPSEWFKWQLHLYSVQSSFLWRTLYLQHQNSCYRTFLQPECCVRTFLNVNVCLHFLHTVIESLWERKANTDVIVVSVCVHF